MPIPNLISCLADISDPWYFKLASFAGGIVATFIGFFLNQYHQNNKEKIKELKEYISSLQSSANELEFYNAKLNQLSGELEKLANTLQQRNVFIIPSYSLYPDFLEKCKIALNTFHKNPHLVKEIGHCHFELCHILARLDFLKVEMSTSLQQSQTQLHIANIRGFKELVDSNIPVFKATCDLLLAEKTSMEHELRLQKDKGLFCNGDK